MYANVQAREEFISHPFWNHLDISENFALFGKVKRLTSEEQRSLLALIAEGFYPISYCSPLAFLRFGFLCEGSRSADIAREIGEIELGMHPLLAHSEFKGVRHCDQLKLMIASLIEGLKIDLPEPNEMALCQLSGLSKADMLKAAAVCEVIENTAPKVIQRYQDFIASWQYVFKIPSGRIQRNYLDEHGLTEGENNPDQHISLINEMLEPLGDARFSSEYAAYVHEFNALCCRHLDLINGKIVALLN